MIEKRGDKSIRDLSFTGVSGFCVEEKTAREESMKNALSQLSLFDGVSVDYSFLSHTLEENGIVDETVESNVTLLSKSLMRVLKFEYYLEKSKSAKGLNWQAWCHIPYSESVRNMFLDDLIQQTSDGVEREEADLENFSFLSPNEYITTLVNVLSYYNGYKSQANKWFGTPNKYTVFLTKKNSDYNQRIEAFYNELELSKTNPGINRLNLLYTYRGTPYTGVVSGIEYRSVPILDSLVITKDRDGFLVNISPLHSGNTSIRFYVDKDQFKGIQCFQDIPVSITLQHIFTGQTIGLCCRDEQGQNRVTSSVFNKLVTEVEGKVIDLSSLSSEDAPKQAADKGCVYLLIVDTRLTDVRENTKQNLFIAFPTLSFRIIDLGKQKVIYETSYPNEFVKDLRGLGKTRETAVVNAYSFNGLLSNKDFLRSFRALIKN